MTGLPAPAVRVQAESWREGVRQGRGRSLPEEVAVALSYDRETFAVMMASPQNLEDFAYGFSLCEGIVAGVEEITGLEIVAVAEGIECRMSLVPARRSALQARRRRIAGPVGCGLCGMESLREAARALPKMTAGTAMRAADIAAGFQAMRARQVLNHETHAVHGAAFLAAGQDMLLREDIGRHNALDKMIGAAARQGCDAAAGAVLLTSRVSLDLVQKCASFGCGILAAISVPTALAVRAAEEAGMTLVAVARDDGFEVFTNPERILF